MTEGVLAMNGRRLLLASAVWEPVEVSFRGAKKVLEPAPLGLHTRPAWRCPACETLVIPPEREPERLVPYTGRSLLRSDPEPDDDDANGESTAVEPEPATWDTFARADEDPLRP
jgi:hypothetical protein